MKPLTNLDELNSFQHNANGKYEERYTNISQQIGAERLSYSLTIVPPGKTVCPYHNHHHTEEMFLILEGEGTLRFGDKRYSLKMHDIIACPPGGRDKAHQITNTGTVDLKYFCLSTKDSMDICEYPDSNKVMSRVDHHEGARLHHLSRLDDKVNYFDGEL